MNKCTHTSCFSSVKPLRLYSHHGNDPREKIFDESGGCTIYATIGVRTKGAPVFSKNNNKVVSSRKKRELTRSKREKTWEEKDEVRTLERLCLAFVELNLESSGTNTLCVCVCVSRCYFSFISLSLRLRRAGKTQKSRMREGCEKKKTLESKKRCETLPLSHGSPACEVCKFLFHQTLVHCLTDAAPLVLTEFTGKTVLHAKSIDFCRSKVSGKGKWRKRSVKPIWRAQKKK